MTQEWYYIQKGQRHGPVSVTELNQLAASGTLQPTDHVWKAGMAEWVVARSVPGLFPQAAAVPPPPPGATAPPPFPPQTAGAAASTNNIPVFKNDPVLVLILGFVTCGLYLIYWNLKASEVLNAVSRREAISPAVAVLAGCCLPANAYFYYLAGQALGDLGKRINKEEELKDKGTLLLILGLFIPMAAGMIVQGHINELYSQQ